MLICVGIPSLDGKVCLETMRSLMAEQMMAEDLGHEICVEVSAGCSLITHARNDLVTGFLQSGADVLVFVDSDMAWEPGALIGLATRPQPFVGGAYRFKSEPENYPVMWLESRERKCGGMIAVGALPGGFLAVKRSAFEAMREANPARTYYFGGEPHYAYFDAPFRDGRLWGEDTAFCQTWRDIGGTVWLDPDLRLTHMSGLTPFIGRVADWIATQTET